MKEISRIPSIFCLMKRSDPYSVVSKIGKSTVAYILTSAKLFLQTRDDVWFMNRLIIYRETNGFLLSFFPVIIL